jgi:hypothetical protein
MERNGPISFPLGLMTPTMAPIISNKKLCVRTKTPPAQIISTAPTMSIFRLPIRSAEVVIHSDTSASPRSVSVTSNPIFSSCNPTSARYSARTIDKNPYANRRVMRVAKRSAISIVERAVRFSLSDHFLTVGIQRVIDNPLSGDDFVVILVT